MPSLDSSLAGGDRDGESASLASLPRFDPGDSPLLPLGERARLPPWGVTDLEGALSGALPPLATGRTGELDSSGSGSRPMPACSVPLPPLAGSLLAGFGVGDSSRLTPVSSGTSGSCRMIPTEQLRTNLEVQSHSQSMRILAC